MISKLVRLAVFQLLFAVGTGAAGQSLIQDNTPPAEASPAPSVDPVNVPRGEGTPVITDGLFSPGEWVDALKLALTETLEIFLKEHREVVFIGIRGVEKNLVGPSEISLAVPGGEIHKLHVSYQLGEIVLPPEGPEPSFRFGYTPDWYASELRRDMVEGERLQKVGKSPIEIIQATSYPSDGIEFAIRRSKFPGDTWLMRFWVSGIIGGKPGAFAYPSMAAERTTEGWLKLRFNEPE